ncbi:MAG: hypothetical protein IT369_08630 [Candidatus Latescibacteria bacterium]|nr:hypothetical protein [Candidatus Latescibacterota bacterium]
MKRCRLLLLALLLAGVGCGGDGGKDENGSPASSGGGDEGGTVVVKATYSGTAKTTGTGVLVAGLFRTLSTAQAIPDYEARTSAEAAVGAEYTLTLSKVAPGEYYLLVYYDLQLHNQHDAGKTDRYVLYEGQHLAAGATALTVRAGAITTPTAVHFGDEFLLGSGGSYQ